MYWTRNGNQKVLAFYGNAQVDVTQADLIYNGTTTPKYVLGLNNQLKVGAFDISFLFMYYGGHVMRVEQPKSEYHWLLAAIRLQDQVITGKHQVMRKIQSFPDMFAPAL